MMTTTGPCILVAINDVFFYTKVRDALAPAGYRLERARSVTDAIDKARASKPAALLLNMNEEMLDAVEALKGVKAIEGLEQVPVLAFANHEEVETFRRAKALGVTKIVSRNEFSARTRELTEEVLRGHGSGQTTFEGTCH